MHWKYAEQINTSRKCSVKSCSTDRVGFSKYCSTHRFRKLAYGDPESRRWRVKDFETEAEQVRQLVQANSNHPGVQKGIQFFQQWINRACTVGGQLAQRQCARLNDEGITAQELLVDCGSIWLYSFDRPWDLPTDTALTYALALAFMCKSHNSKGCVSSRGIGTTVRRKVGEHIRNGVGMLLSNFRSTLKQAEKDQEETRRLMSQPLQSVKPDA